MELAKRGKDFNEICWALATADVELATALHSCDHALEKSAGQSYIADSRGFVLLKLKRYDDAIAQYNQALAWDPTLAASLFGRGVAKRRKGDMKSGDEDIKAAKDFDPRVGEEFDGYGVRP